MAKYRLKLFVFIFFIATSGFETFPLAGAAVLGNNYISCYSEGERALAASEFDMAASNFAQALKYKPDDLRAHLKYAQALFALKKYEESQKHLQIVLRNSPNNIIARINLVETLLQLGNKESAKEQLNWILRVQPNHQRAMILYSELSGMEYRAEGTKAKTVLEPGQTVKAEEKIVVTHKVSEKCFKSHIPESKTASNSKASEDNISFTPYVQGKKQVVAKEAEGKKLLPEPRTDIGNTDIKSFFQSGKDSYVVTIEKARYEIETGDLTSAIKSIELADNLARAKKNSRHILEAQIFKSLVYIYQCEFTKFGKHLMTLKNVLSPETYQSFLDIYSQAGNLKAEKDRRRLAAGVAVGAGHSSVVAFLLKPIFDNKPDDILTAMMLANAQMDSYDYSGAEKTFKKILELNPDNIEVHLDLARFYLTAKYNADLVRKHSEVVLSAKPNDPRIGVILGLTDYSQGRVADGIKRIEALLSSLEDPGMKAVCQQIIADGESVKINTDTSDNSMIIPEIPTSPSSQDNVKTKLSKVISSKDFIAMLALPGSENASSMTNRFAGEESLKAGSYFTAIDRFSKIDDRVEMGRVYLALASALTSANEMETAAIAAGYGMKLINSDAKRDMHKTRGALYTALYEYQREEYQKALTTVFIGLRGVSQDHSDDVKTREETVRKLVGLRNELEKLLSKR